MALSRPSRANIADWYKRPDPEDRERAHTEIQQTLEQRLPEFNTEFSHSASPPGGALAAGIGRLSFNDQGEPIRRQRHQSRHYRTKAGRARPGAQRGAAAGVCRCQCGRPSCREIFYSNIYRANDELLRLFWLQSRRARAGELRWIAHNPPSTCPSTKQAIVEARPRGAHPLRKNGEYTLKDGSRVPVMLWVQPGRTEARKKRFFVLPAGFNGAIAKRHPEERPTPQ